MTGKRHKRSCRCMKCLVTSETCNSIDTIIHKIQQLYKKAILNQLKFKLCNRGRFNSYSYLSKCYNDEYINVITYSNQLIRCRKCKKIRKALLTHRWSCIKCSNSDWKQTDGWQAWIG